MDKNKILVLGHNGYLGSYLSQNLSCDTTKYPITQISDKYDYVVNCIAKSDWKWCEHNISQSNYSNRDVIKDIIKYCPRAKIIHFSSYYVYNDTGLCTETSNTTDKYHYCRQKLEADQIVEQHGGLILRLGKLFGHPDLLKQYRFTEHVILSDNILADKVIFNPTHLWDVLDVINHELDHQNLFGVYNVSNNGTCTHLEWANLINLLLEENKTINAVDSLKQFDHYGNFAMNTNKIEQIIKLRTYKESLEQYIYELKQIRHRVTN